MLTMTYLVGYVGQFQWTAILCYQCLSYWARGELYSEAKTMLKTKDDSTNISFSPHNNPKMYRDDLIKANNKSPEVVPCI